VFSVVTEQGEEDEALDSDWPTRLAIRSPYSQPPKRPQHSDGMDALAILMDEALAANRPDAIAPMVATRFTRLAEDCEGGKRVDDEAVAMLARYAVKLAAATGNGVWFNLLLRIYLARAELFPLGLVNAWYSTLRRARGVDWEALRRYVDLVGSSTAEMSPAERFASQRIAGLLRYAPGRANPTAGRPLAVRRPRQLDDPRTPPVGARLKTRSGGPPGALPPGVPCSA